MFPFILLLVVFLVVAALGVASALGATADTRDPAYSAGRLLYKSEVKP